MIEKISWNIIAVLCLLFLTLVSCRKTGSPGGGTAIQFVAESEASITKTTYSGQLFPPQGQNRKERINWVQNDLIRIACSEASATEFDDWADYEITTVQSSGLNSVGYVTPVGGAGTGLQWDDESIEYDFHALYPSPATSGMGSTFISMNAQGKCISRLRIPPFQSLSWTFPGESGRAIVGSPDMRYAYMFAYAHSGYSSNVTLHFEPVFTAFRFQIRAPISNDVELTQFTLRSYSNSIMGGNFYLECDTDHTISVLEPSEDNFSIVVYFPPHFIVPANTMLDFTVFALPQDYDDLLITFSGTYGSFDASTMTLYLKDNLGQYLDFSGFRKYVITGLRLPSSNVDSGTKSPILSERSVPVDSFKDCVEMRDGEIWLNMADEKYNHEWVVLEKK